MCPASTTREGRSKKVRATMLLPKRSTVSRGRARSPASIASANGPSLRLTDGKSTSAAVSATAPASRSSAAGAAGTAAGTVTG